MPVNVYGIFLAYPPTVQLRHEGLGRYLMAFLQASANKPDIRFLVACPSWLKHDLLKLCEEEGVPPNSFDLLSPMKKPTILRLYEAYLAYRHRPRRNGRLKRAIASLIARAITHRRWIEQKLVTSRSMLSLLLIMGYITTLQSILLPCYMIVKICRAMMGRINKRITPYWERLQSLLINPKHTTQILRLYNLMEQGELDLMLNQINRSTHVKAWYCHTAFWPSFNRIKAPRLMCVPDVILTEFPVGFSDLGGDRYLESFNAVEKAIKSAEHFVTYSGHIKVNTLIREYAIKPDKINVVRHAPNDLSRWIRVKDCLNREDASCNYCQRLLMSALQKATNSYYKRTMNKSFKFIFYASQFRPSKNILALLRAYEHLLRERYIGHKLILTGNLQVMPAIKEYILQNNLANDVLCLHGLTSPELAACYKLADLAVNPSLSEGACPFTLTEALSVDTPVVMARIPVTEEIIKDHSLREIMLFDPYDWKNMADRIEWALANRAQLLAVQQGAYQQLSQRNWGDVVNEHIEIMDRISSNIRPQPAELPDIKAPDKPLVFVHVPKTAGTAFMHYLRSNILRKEIIAPPFIGNTADIDLDNHDFKLYWGHIRYEMVKQTKRGAYFLTFLREPLSRVISQYKSWHKPENLSDHWLSVMHPYEIEALQFTQSATLEEFIMSDNPHIVDNIRDLQTRLLSDEPDSDTMLESAMKNLREQFYFVGIMERYDDSIALFRRLFNQTCAYTIPQTAENRSLISVPPLSAAMIERVKELNKNDFELYDFALKNFAARFEGSARESR